MQKDVNNKDNFINQQLLGNNIYPQQINNMPISYNMNNLNNFNLMGNSNNLNNLNKFQNFNNMNPIGNINYINNMSNMPNLSSHIFDHQPKQQQIINSGQMQNFGFNLNDEVNLNNLNNNNFNNRLLNKNNINNSPMGNPNLLNVYMNPNMLQNLSYSGPINKLVKNNNLNNSINLNNKISLSSQGTKNTIPNFNMNQIDNLNLNNVFVPNKMNQQGIPIMLNPLLNKQNFSSQSINHINNNIFNHIPNNSILKNEQNNSQILNRDINMNMNFNSKTYKHGGKKKDFNQDFNDDNDNKKKNNMNNNRLNDNNNKLRNKDNSQNNPNNENSNKKNRKRPILIVKVKNGKNTINIDINSNNNMENEIMKKLKEQTHLDGKIINLIQQKIKDAVNTMNNILQKPLKLYSYKQIKNINNLIFNQSNRNNTTFIRRNNSVKELDFIYEMINNNLKPNLYDIKKNDILNNSF